MATEQNPQSNIPDSSYVADSPHSRSPLERVLRTALHLRRASIHFSFAADELQVASAEINSAGVVLPESQPRAHAARLAVQCSAQCRGARGQAEALAQYARRADDLAASARGVPLAELKHNHSESLSSHSTMGEARVGSGASQDGGAL